MVSTGFPFFRRKIFSKIWENLFESFTEVPQGTSSSPPNKKDPYGYFFEEAETEGFEPSVLLRGRLVSSEVLSTTQPRLHHVFIPKPLTSLEHYSRSEVSECSFGPTQPRLQYSIM